MYCVFQTISTLSYLEYQGSKTPYISSVNVAGWLEYLQYDSWQNTLMKQNFENKLVCSVLVVS